MSREDGKDLPLEKIIDYVYRQIPMRSEAAHTGELSWLIFWARELQIPLNAAILSRTLRLRSSVCALLIFDMMQRGLINGPIETSFWHSFANADGLKSEMWLLAYEVTKKEWWPQAQEAHYITSHPFFGELWNRDVEFYEPKRKSRPQVGKSFFAMVASLSPGVGGGGYPH